MCHCRLRVASATFFLPARLLTRRRLTRGRCVMLIALVPQDFVASLQTAVFPWPWGWRVEQVQENCTQISKKQHVGQASADRRKTVRGDRIA